MTKQSRWEQVSDGMTLEEVKEIFGKDIWQSPGFDSHTWLVNNETDPSPDHGYTITFFENGKFRSKGTFTVLD